MMIRALLIIVILLAVAAWAQDAPSASGGSAVIESVDEDIVDDPADPSLPIVEKKSADDKDPKVDSDIDKGLDLDALLLSDEEDDLLIDEKPVVKKATIDTLSVDSSSSPASSPADKIADEKVVVDDKDTSAASTRAEATAAKSKSDPEVILPAVIEDGRTINFAHNLKGYRSPRKAMLMSLLVPGLGQMYARSYVKGGAFMAVEAAAIGAAVYFNSTAKKRKDEAYAFADRHFSLDALQNYGSRLKIEFESPEREAVRDKENIDITPPYDLYLDDTSAFAVAAKNKQTYFYESIRGGYYTPGWDDNDIPLDRIISSLKAKGDTVVGVSGSVYGFYESEPPEVFFYMIMRVADDLGRSVNEGPMLGYSKNQITYDGMIERANSARDAVTYTFYALLLNHIASAIDAGFTARAYNAKLLGQESVWDRVSVEQQYVFTGSEVSPGLALRLRF